MFKYDILKISVENYKNDYANPNASIIKNKK